MYASILVIIAIQGGADEDINNKLGKTIFNVEGSGKSGARHSFPFKLK